MKAIYKRVIIKISGEALSSEGNPLDKAIISKVVADIKAIREMGVEVGITIGGGNFWRGRQGESMDRATADHMGMLATVINALALQDAFEQEDIPTRVLTALTITRVAEPYIQRKAIRHLEKCRVIIFACGTGNPYFSTDTGAALRAAEINAEIILLAKNVEGRIQKYYKDVCLLEQAFVKDQDKTIKEYLNETIASIGEKITIRRFTRYEMGEGLEKREDNFVDEVMGQVNKTK